MDILRISPFEDSAGCSLAMHCAGETLYGKPLLRAYAIPF